MLFNRKKYRVKLQGRAGLIYEENSRSMLIDSEMLAGTDFDIVIYLTSIKAWDIPHQSELVNEEDKVRIRDNITCKLSKYKIDWK
jgi:Immunity protein 74